MKNTRQRLVKMLEQDKEEMNEATRAAAVRDFAHVAEEYFETDGVPEFQMKRTKGGYEVTVSFRTVRVKNFSTFK